MGRSSARKERARAMNDASIRPGRSPAEAPRPAELEDVRHYWNNHIHDWKVARSEPGTKAFFDEIEAYRFEKLHYLPRLVDFAGYAHNRVLDVGCGLGNDLSRFARQGATVVGIDLAERAIDLARQNFEQRGLAGEFYVMDGEHMEFADASFDVVYCHTVVHFTPHPAQLVQEIHRVLRPGGQAIIMTVNRRSWLNFLKKLMSVDVDHLDAPVFYQFTADEFYRLLAPFDQVRIVPERFPVRTKIHGGLKAKLYNGLFVDLFNALPRRWTAWSGHHLMAFAFKAPLAMSPCSAA
jgi:2-polyprenyl-3-methyl-5-hydroxy-6-metoxy-1,4-benzoquinol methylase